MTTIGQAVSRLRNNIKAVKQDPFITDRFLYSLILKYGQAYIKQQDTIKKLLRLGSLFRTVPCLKLTDSNLVESCCGPWTSDCKIKRTEDRVPNIMEAEFGPVFRTISSIDGSIELFPTTPSSYVSMTKTSSWKYNNRKYYWFIDGYIFIPDIAWDSIKLEGIFEGDLSGHTCSDSDECSFRQDQPISIPDFLLAESEKMALQDLGIVINSPMDTNISDKNSQLR